MKTLLTFVCVLFIAGCSTVQPPETMVVQPELLEQTQLPPITGTFFNQNMRLTIRLLIDEEGNVKKAKFIDGSGNEEWDSVALLSIEKWRFTPARMNNKPVKLWVNQIALVKILEPVYLSMSEILCDSLETANFIYQALLRGENFEFLAAKYSKSPTRLLKGYIGKVDVNLYSTTLRAKILRLRDNEFSEPIKYGEKYIIFKRHALLSNVSYSPRTDIN